MKRIRLAAIALVPIVAVLVLPASPASAAGFTACANQVPAGWVKVDDSWDPASCGNPSSYTLNVWTIANPAWVPVGGRMEVCAGWRPNDQPPPNGSKWSLRAVSWNPNKCGHPASYLENIWTIERTR
jgi:hypothetical protein